MEYFRQLTSEDKEQVIRICKSIWEGDDYIPNIFDKWVQADNSYFIGLFQEEKLIGFGRLASHGDGNYWLEGLRKDHELQLKGIGKKIANHLIKIAIEKECKSLKFSTYFDNVESIALNEKIGFSKIKEWSYLELELDKLDKHKFISNTDSLGQPSLEEFTKFLLESKFYKEMDGYLCQGWKVFNVSDKYLTQLYHKSLSYIIANGEEIEAMVTYVIDNDENIFITLLEYSTKDQCSLLLNRIISQAFKENRDAVSIIVPSHSRVDCLENFAFKSWERKDDFLLYAYQGKL